MDYGLFHQIAKPLNLTTYTASGGGAGKYLSNLSLPGLVRKSPADQASFDQSNQLQLADALHWLKKRKDSILIVTFAYSDQLPKTAYLINHQLIGIDSGLTKKYDDYQPILNALDKIRFDIGDRKLIVVGDFPGSSYIPEYCLGRLRWLERSKKCRLQMSRSKNLKAIHINTVLSEYANRHPNTYFIDPYSVFCDKHLCYSANDKGDLYYSDGGHLSKTGSLFFIKKIKYHLLSIIN